MKIENQGIVLDNFDRNDLYLKQLAKNVKSGDAENAEAQAAQYYWKTLSPALTKGANSFKRERFGEDPNHLLNYGYTILRAIVARSLVGSGLLPTLGIFHRNQYNAYCLADDIMEPYRPIIDNYIIDILQNDVITNELSPEIKAKLLKIPVLDVEIDKERSPLTIAVQRTTASLARSFETGKNVMIYPKQLSYKIIF
ncbi:type II CRISPR-associated endonuclease Cas1 [Pseudarcicella hirudinis]